MIIDFTQPIQPQFENALLSQDDKTKLDLSGNDLGVQATAQIILVLQSIPASVTHVDLSNNHLHRLVLYSRNYAAILAAIPETVTSLNLSSNSLHFLTQKRKFFQSLPPTINTLILGLNNFYNLGITAFSQIIAAIPSTVTTLSLGQCHLATFTTSLINIFSTVTASTLDLSDNALGTLVVTKKGVHLDVSDFKLAIAGISKTVTHLNLAGNSLGTLTVSELTAICSSVPPQVKILNLSNNHFKFSEEQWIEILSPLAGTVEKFIIDDAHDQELITRILTKIREEIVQLQIARSVPLPSASLVLGQTVNPNFFWTPTHVHSHNEPKKQTACQAAT